MLSTGQVQTILVTGRDQTAQAEIEAELQRMKSLAEETTATLSQLTPGWTSSRRRPARPRVADKGEEFEAYRTSWRRRRRPRLPRESISAAVRGGPIATGRASPP